jgi:ferrochelatase
MRPPADPQVYDDVGAVLLQMGGPVSLDEVESFLRLVLSDPDLIQLPPWTRGLQPAIGAVGAMARARSVRPMYEAVGGGSPIVPTTMRLAKRLEASLHDRGIAIPVAVAMRYSHPRADEAVDALRRAGVRRVLLLPLYPHYSRSTVGSSVNDFLRASAGAPWEGEATVLPEWGLHPRYLSLLTDWVQSTLDRVRRDGEGSWNLLFSAHGLPRSYVRAGDAYPDRVREAAERVARKVTGCDAWHLSFQSRMGPMEWTRPYTDEALEALGADGVRAVVTVPMGFVSDHLETLYEIDILYRDIAREAGIRQFHRVPAFNDHPDFADLLAELVLETLGGEGSGG